jgi:hypothetical protein
MAVIRTVRGSGVNRKKAANGWQVGCKKIVRRGLIGRICAKGGS